MQSSCKLKSCISKELKRSTAIRGFSLAILGACLLFYSGTSLSVETLSKWGLIFFFLSLFLIRAGLVPYRKLCKRELLYDELLVEKNFLLYLSKEYGKLTIYKDTVQSLRYKAKGIYGIEMFFTKGFTFCDPVSKRYHLYCQKKYKCDWFFPYFSNDSFRTLKTCLQDVVHA